jgi:GntR family transcriptional regulator
VQLSRQLEFLVQAIALDRESIVPLYYQIQQSLLGQIQSGALKAGDAIPSEGQISARLGVSRMTARQALKSLCSMGVVYSQRGKGTFVAATKLEKTFRQLLSFSEEMQARGSHPRSRVLAFRRMKPDRELAEALHLAADEDVILLRRVRLADMVPFCIESAHLPLSMFPDLLEHFDPRGSLYQAIESRYGVKIAMADEVAEAGIANAEEARLLRIRVRAPVFRFTRVAYLRQGKPVEFVKSTYRGDRCKVVNRLSRQV